MEKFRYALQLTGSLPNLGRFLLDLEKLGYEISPTHKEEIKVSVAGAITTKCTFHDSVYVWFCSPKRIVQGVDYSFNIDEEYDLALAVASQREDGLPHLGEWIVGVKSAYLEEGKLYKIRKSKDQDGAWTSDSICVEGITGGEYRGTTSLDNTYSRKATAEEIIEYFRKNNKKEEKAMTPKTGNPFKVGDKVIFISKESKVSTHDAQFWESDRLVLGKEYTVRKLDNNGVRSSDDFVVLEDKIYCLPYDMFELKVPIYENYAVWCETLDQAKKLSAYQKGLFGFGEEASAKYSYRIGSGNTRMCKYGRLSDKGRYMNENTFNIEAEIEFEQWEKMLKYKKTIDMKGKKVVSYKLIKEYPSSPAEKVLVYQKSENVWFSKPDGQGGTFVKNPELYPEVWEPVYGKTEICEEVSVDYELGDESFTLKVSSDGYIEVVDVDDEEGTRFDYADLKRVLSILRGLKGSKWALFVNYITIGCKHEVCVEHLEVVMETYERLNNIK